MDPFSQRQCREGKQVGSRGCACVCGCVCVCVGLYLRRMSVLLRRYSGPAAGLILGSSRLSVKVTRSKTTPSNQCRVCSGALEMHTVAHFHCVSFPARCFQGAYHPRREQVRPAFRKLHGNHSADHEPVFRD